MQSSINTIDPVESASTDSIDTWMKRIEESIVKLLLYLPELPQLESKRDKSDVDLQTLVVDEAALKNPHGRFRFKSL